MSVTIETYGPGGFDPAAADGGVVETVTVPVAPEAVNADTLHQRARTALASNRAFISDSTITTAEAIAQTKALSRQMNAVIRLLLNELDGTD